jgi:hypothetical protein
LGTAADVDDLNLYAVPAEEILLDTDPQSRYLFIEDPMGDTHQGQLCRSAETAEQGYEKKGKTKNGK